jgi:omega-6 fatty acid desaturase (delta-12 desaturase)
MTLPDPIRVVPKATILKELAPFARPHTGHGLALFFLEYLLYWGSIALVLFAPMPWKVAGAIFAGIKLTAFVTLGHDAAHRTLVEGKMLNKVLACALLLPCVHNFRLWIWDHHEIHHPMTNGEHFDSFTPYSKAEFDLLPRRKQLFERIIRAPNVIGFGLHYLFQRMPRVRIWPTAAVPARHHASAWRHTGALAVYHAAFLGLLTAAPSFAPVTVAQALVLGFVVPLCVFATITGASLYVMHTHRSVPWFKGELDRRGDAAVEYCSTDMTLPAPLSKLVHHVFSHSVHHAHPGVPCYHVPAAQRRLNELLGERAVSHPLSFGHLFATMRACKLYDFEKHQWLDFDGKPTTAPMDLGRSGRAEDIA